MSTPAISSYRDHGLLPGTTPQPTWRFPAVRPWRALMAFAGADRLDVGSVRSFERTCIVPDDPGEVVRGAKPISSDDRDRMREQHISRLMADYRRQH